MSNRLSLEEFSVTTPAQSVAESTWMPEDERLAVYEEGYKAGWDDAAAAEQEIQTRVSADFANTLKGLSVSFNEAREHVLKSVAPVLRLMAEKVLPDLARHGLAEMVAERARYAIEHAAGGPIELVINPDNRPALEHILSDDAGLPVVITEQASLGPGQAYLRSTRGEEMVDLDRLIQEIRDAVEAFLHAHEEEAKPDD